MHQARRVIRRTLRAAGTASLTALALLLLIVSMGRGDGVSELRATVGGYEQDLVRWEVTHFLDKWLHRVAELVLFRSSDERKRQEAVAEFFAIGQQLREARSTVQRLVAATADLPAEAAAEAQRDLDRLEARREELRPIVEETLEAAISQALDELDVIDRFGPIRWPPVDFTFERGSLVLVRSPRDVVDRLDDVLLDPDISLLEQLLLEAKVDDLDPANVSLVVRVGGVATYPAQVSPDRSLHGTLALASHEWLHHWLAFRPLGQRWSSGGAIQAINETAANIFAEEAGDRALEMLTGEVFERAPWRPPTLQARDEPPEGVFDFRREMRRTRLDLDALLDRGAVEEAERFLEEQRQEFVANGFHIRKLNNAWFAFNGTYADSPASVSPIEGQLRVLRGDSASLAEWLDRIAGVTEAGELEALALAAGWVPIDPRTGLPAGGQ